MPAWLRPLLTRWVLLMVPWVWTNFAVPAAAVLGFLVAVLIIVLSGDTD